MAGNLLAFKYSQRNALVLQRLALPFNVAPLVGIKNRQIIIKGIISLILPSVTLVTPTEIAMLEHPKPPLMIGKKKAAARHPKAAAQLIYFSRHECRQSCLIFTGGNYKAIPGHGCKRAHSDQFWIILNSQTCGDIGPDVVKNKLSGTVRFDVQRSRCCQSPGRPYCQMMRQPACFSCGTA